MKTVTTPSRVAICLATYRRPELLRELLDSFKMVRVPRGIIVELRVVDNDRTGSSMDIINAFRDENHPFFKVTGKIEPEQNIAMARNVALDIGPADAIVFVDDDEIVEEGWLEALLQTGTDSGADAVFGPVHGRLPDGVPQWMSRGCFYDKRVAPTGTVVDWKQTRTSNTLVLGAWFYGRRPFRFDPALGRSGGSDSDLFARIAEHGAKLVTCREAIVSEEVPAARATLGWLWSRWYRNGLIYERIARAIPHERSSMMRFLRRLGATGLLLCRGLPSLLRGRFEGCAAGLFELSLAMGGFVAWMRPESTVEHVAYRASRQEKDEKTTEAKPHRVAFLCNIISPYRQPVYKHLSETPGWDFRVFIDADNEFDREWSVDGVGLQVRKTRCLSWKRTVWCRQPIPFKQVITLHFPFGLLYDLFRFRPQTVISSELGFRTAFAALYCGLTHNKLVIWSYQSRVSGTQGSWREAWRRWLLSRADSVVGMGIQAREVLEGWGVPSSHIVDILNSANHHALENQMAAPEFQNKVDAIRTRYGSDRKLAIVVGRLIPLKGIEGLLETWSQLPDSTRSNWTLVFAGSGPMEALLRDHPDESVKLAGYIPEPEIAAWYTATDLHIFPTRGDVWGLVVNEASICGTPTLCSVHAGCFDDVIDDGKNGLAIDFTGDDAPRVLQEALEHPDLEGFGVAARKHIRGFTLERMVAGFRQAAGQEVSVLLQPASGL
ncbi:MAG: glycosyltransferase [Puniceicoccaceae bacterium]